MEKSIPRKPVHSKSYKARDKDTISTLKEEIKNIQHELKLQKKIVQEYEDNWDSMSDEFYYNRILVQEYEKRFGKISIKRGN